jgi:chromosome transmission fidelity protein 1
MSPQGKSLSIICGALKWLIDRDEKDKEQLDAVLAGRLPASVLHGPVSAPGASEERKEPNTKKEPDWFSAYDEKKAESEALQQLRDAVEHKKRQEEKLRRLREEHRSSNSWKWKRKVSASRLTTFSSS